MVQNTTVSLHLKKYSFTRIEESIGLQIKVKKNQSTASIPERPEIFV